MLKYKSLSSPDMIKIHETMKSGKMSDWQVLSIIIYGIYSLKVIQTYWIHPSNKKEQTLIFHILYIRNLIFATFLSRALMFQTINSEIVKVLKNKAIPTSGIRQLE